MRSGTGNVAGVNAENLPTRPFAGMTQIRFKGFGLRHLSPLQDTPRRHWLYDNYCRSTTAQINALFRRCCRACKRITMDFK